MLQSSEPGGGTSPRRWPAIGWSFSLIFVAALLGIAATAAYQALAGGGQVQGQVLDAYTNKPVPGAVIQIGTQQLTSDSGGSFRVNHDVTSLDVSKPGYDPTAVAVASDSLQVKVRPNVVTGKVLNKGTQQPLAGASVQAKVGNDIVRSATTDDSGHYVIADVPDGAKLTIQSNDFAPVTVDIDHQTQIDAQLRPDVLTGTITDDKGAPVEGAMVAVGQAQTQTGKDGTYRLQGAPDSGAVIVKAPGYKAVSTNLDPSLHLSTKLSPIKVDALYASAGTVGSPDELNSLIKIADTTEVNALVVDLKDSSGTVYYDSQVPLAKEIGAVEPAYDAKQIVQTLHQHNIYAIARIVCFEDPILAEKHPEWAIHDSTTGGLWRDWNGLAWVNAHRSEVWDYNIALAKEAAALGFDEVQFDYVRFPSDGPLDRATYGEQHDDQTRPKAIGDFLAKAHDALAPTQAYLAADVFGLTMWATDDSGIGQQLEAFAPHLDYICPMVYPSHFYTGSMGFDIPNDHPYEVILWSLQAGEQQMPEIKNKLRPWLQDFSLGPGIKYGDNEVRRQIDAANDFGATGWLIWNPASTYHQGALKPES